MKNFDMSDPDMLDDYSDVLEEFQEAREKINEVDSDKLSKADYDYYIEVLERTEEKLDSVE